MKVFIQRPIFALAINLILLIIGLVSYFQLPTRHQVNKDNLEISIYTLYSGASHLVVEKRVTKPIEDALSGVDGVKSIRSTSQDDLSHIQVKFNQDVDYYRVIGLIRDRLQAISEHLPKEAEVPYLYEESEHSKNIAYIAVFDQSRTKPGIYDYLNRYVIDDMKLLDGVANAEIFGTSPYAIEIQIDPVKLAQFPLSVSDIVNLLKQEKVYASGGSLETDFGKKTLILSAPFETPDALKHITIYQDEQIGPIYLGNIADIKVSFSEPSFKMKLEGEDVVGIAINSKPKANPMTVVSEVRHYLDKIKTELPSSMKTELIYERTKPFERAIATIQTSIIEAIVIVCVIMVLSLGSLRAAVIPMLTIPLCLVTNFALMSMLAFSINPVTLLAMVLSVGLVVDDSIVVVENIHKFIEKGQSALSAAMMSMKEITFSIVVMTITLAAVYVPLAFQTSVTSKIFKEFAWTLAGTVLISGIVALTLTPAICGRWLDQDFNFPKIEKFWHWMSYSYKKLLLKALRIKGIVVIAMLTLGGIGVYTYLKLPTEIMPMEDEDIVSGWFAYENNVPKNMKEEWMRDIRSIIEQEVPEKKYFLVGQHNANMWWELFLTPRSERNRSTKTIGQQLEKKLKNFYGPMVGVNVSESNSNSGDKSIDLLLYETTGPENLRQKSKSIIDKLEKISFIQRVKSDHVKLKSRYKISINRPLASKLNVSVSDIETMLHTFFSGRKVMEFNFDGLDYDVIIKANSKIRESLSGLNQYFVKGPTGVQIPIGVLVKIEEVVEQEQITHFNRLRGIKIKMWFKPDADFQASFQQVKYLLKSDLIEQPHRFKGAAEKYNESISNMKMTLILSICFIFLVLAALFESFLDPFIVLLTVPLSIIGAVALVYICHGTNNIYTQIGMVTLIGLISKHGILITDFANRLRLSGETALNAVIKASVARFRPIIMTSLAMIGGAIPLMYSIGAGSEARHHIAWVIVGGMLTGTFFSLIVIPSIYYLIALKKEK